MRFSRFPLVLAAVVALLLAACGNDADQPAGEATAADTAAAAPEETTASEEETTAAEEESAAEEGASADVDLAALCESDYADVEAPEDFNIGLVTDVGSVDDGSFNQFAYEGMLAAGECFGIETNFIETANQADYQNNLNTILADDPEVVISTGFLLADATLAAAQENPDVRYVGIDQSQEEYPDNYVGVLFREDQGGFLAGAMAGLLTESGVIGVVGGREDVPPVVRYVNGYEEGAHYIDDSIQVLQVYNESFDDPAKGASDAQQMLGEGADVIFGAGGVTGSGGVSAAAEAGAWGIGVDQDQYFTLFSGGSAPGADRIATSAVKRVDLGVFTQVAAAIQDEFAGGVFELTAENGGITYAPSHDADVPQEVAAQLEEVRAGLADGSISTNLDPATGLPQ